MVVPGPGRGDDEVALFHDRPLAVDRRVGAAALDDEAEGRGGMAVGRRHFARHDELQAGIERLGDAGIAGQAGILEDQDPALRLLGGDESAGFHHMGAHVGPFPQMRLGAADRLLGHETAQDLPQGGHTLLADILVEGLAFRCRFWRFHVGSSLHSCFPAAGIARPPATVGFTLSVYGRSVTDRDIGALHGAHAGGRGGRVGGRAAGWVGGRADGQPGAAPPRRGIPTVR